MRIERIFLRDIGPFDDVTIEFPKGNNPDLADVYLLTGQNGTGKSTVLYAIASVLGGDYLESGLGKDFLFARMRSSRSLAVLGVGDNVALGCALYPIDIDALDDFDWAQAAKLEVSSSGPHSARSIGDYHYAQQAYAFKPLEQLRHSYDWAAFAYAGVRSVVDVKIASIKEPVVGPFENSLSFTQTADTEQLANWVANQNFRRLKAKEAGNQERADQLADSVRRIETTIGEIIGDECFGFDINDQDDDVRIRWNGRIVRLGLLPDGLKSSISWVADLLMRLDRIPWKDNVSVLQRSFLLLLDEIDIHLHPAWQRKVLPLVQRVFPNAQIIVSTHSPFVVGSVDDAHIITLGLQGSSSVVKHVSDPQIGVSYTAVAREIFGIDSEFDVDTEDKLEKFHQAKNRLLTGEISAQAELDQLADLLSHRSEELREIIALERNQLRRQLAKRAAP
jgi:energy-coupling factor transporter ATP-binding protein EcfA2